MPDSRPLIELDGVGKQYAKRSVLHGLNLTVAAAESVALLGHNGAGKTTLMKLLLGLTRPSSGRIRIDGEDPTHLLGRGLHAGIGFLPENVMFNNAMSGYEVLRFYARLKRVAAGECGALLAQVGLGEAAQRRIGTYSKGMRQRLGLAQALLGRPRVLLLDEPTTGLDPQLREVFYARVQQHVDGGGSALIASHALTEIEARCARVAILRQGELVALGTLAELRERTQLPVRIRVTAAPGGAAALAARLDGGVRLVRINGETLDLTCPGKEKLDLVARLTGLRPALRDMEIHPPGLDAIYAHYSSGGAPR